MLYCKKRHFSTHFKGDVMGNYFFGDTKYITNLSGTPYNPADPTYIISYEELRNLMNTMCTRLKHPITIININYDCQEPEKKRVDSDVSYFSLRSTCRNLRIAAGESYCMNCDEYYTQYCKSLIENAGSKTAPPSYFSEIGKRELPRLRQYIDRSYLLYNCPMLGYCEMCFPIYFSKRIIGFLIVGEILLQNHDEKRTAILNDFLNIQDPVQNPDSIFKAYYSKWQKKHPNEPFPFEFLKTDSSSPEKLLENFEEDSSLKRTDYKHPLSKRERQTLINNCCKEVTSLETFLEREWDSKVRHFFKEKTASLRAEFNTRYYQLREKPEITYQEEQSVLAIIWDTVLKLKKQFPFSCCRLYSNLPGVSDNADWCSEKSDEYLSSIRCDFSKVPLSMSQCRNSVEHTGYENPLLCFLDAEGNLLDEDCFLALACENLAVLFKINADFKAGERDKEHLKLLIREISRLFLHMCADLDRISSLFLQQQHEKTLHLYRHECAHLAKRIQDNNRYYEDRERYENLPPDKRENVYRDILSTAILLQHLSTNIGMILGNTDESYLKRQKTGFVNLWDELNKWRAMFRLELRNKNLRLRYDGEHSNIYRPLYTYTELFGILIYNLIDNAIKYSYWGTTIYIEITQNQFIIKDYGVMIEDGNRPYDLYYRAENTAEYHLGDGIGLYSSQKIAKLLGLELTHRCEKLSDLHIPFVYEAVRQKIAFDGFKIQNALKQFAGIEKRSVLSIRGDYYDSDFSTAEEAAIRREINQPTYCVTFIISGLENLKGE